MKGKNRAFTLAEVLITLGIIGIVAAMTIPTLISEYQERTYIESFKKAYAEISQAYLRAAQENGTADTWATDQDIYNNMNPYFKIAEDCPLTTGCFAKNYKGLKGNDTGLNLYNNIYYKIQLASGVSILFHIDSAYRDLTIDTNGQKGPNRFGYDLFIISLSSKSGSPIVTRAHSDAWPTTRYCSLTQDASGWYDGGACARWILKKWNMDYLHREIASNEW